MTGHVATADIDISASAADVWKALTEPDLIEKYLVGARVESSWEPGTPITWKGEYDGRSYEDKGEVLVVEPEHRLEVTHFSPLSGQPDAPENYHRVAYEITDHGDKVHLTLSQDNNASEDEARHSAETWRTMLENLKRLLERD
ncbi:MAG TPA: SRPBCC domain-containing protein [Nocardioidaceae bacterium]|nr:SRPBCC domain-containing protein [Nocardioidaceae bacterium]